ncbi:type I pullulanase [Sporosarcina sp. Marseille-Q4063]|uniref:type I pullulanase n=1 Tax=Sporosarcina sp. Marseille-Q4063 TaxID=2810514 RepID=UPI001BAE66B1|nr:type I pullulanase [Sporosarcina sp. Marseille-Q4063]QUW22985.1 type I pullulanase [Sporosarcina sp. Marseille-Q4063]
MKNLAAWIDDVFVLTVKVPDAAAVMKETNPPIIHWAAMDKYFPVKLDHAIDATIVRMTLVDELPMGEDLFLNWGKLRVPIYPRAIVRTDWFEKRYSCLETELGAVYEETATTFSVWAPTATCVTLFLGDQIYALKRGKNGIWSSKISGNWHEFPYQYEVTVNGQTTRVNDPYSKALLVNSEKSVVVDLSKTNPAGFAEHIRPEQQHLQDAIIYELHVRDATMQEAGGIYNKGKFLGLTEANTTTENGYSTGISYIKELGCTHVQILPINDFARVNEQQPEKDYNWGYDPLYFQVPEGSYSTAPENPISRIKESKEMIHAFHQAGISVILDVVYNHVFVMEESAFEKLVPGYYFRYHADGNLSNGTGVGNDFATERKMAQKFILDTIDFWLSEYRVAGFRFDLMGAMDIETIQKIRDRCAVEVTPIMLLGEGWDLPTALPTEMKATSSNSNQLADIRFFNDYFRDSVKGNLFNADDKGYINGDGRFIERLPNLVSGSVLDKFGAPFVSEVNQTINYVECHDNHTLWDRLQLTNPQSSADMKKKMHQLATGITLLSQGVPFLHAGQEWFRSKQGDENSYISGDHINQLDWKMRESEDEHIQFIKKLIAIRRKYRIFRLRSKQDIQERFQVLDTPAPVFGFTLFGDNEDFAIYMNPTNKHWQLHLPSSGKWQVLATNHLPGQTKTDEIPGEFTRLNPYELIVLKRPLNPRDK